MNERMLLEKFERGADHYYKKYRTHMQILENHSPLAKIRGINLHDYVALGEQLDQFTNYLNFVNESGSVADLGKIPDIALDVISASYGASIVPLIASVQPIEEERGIIYYKTLKAQDSRGNVTAQQITQGALAAPQAYPVGYANENQTVILGATTSGVMSYSGDLSAFKVRPRTVNINVNTATPIRAIDDGAGNILGVGLQGTINYATGAVVVGFIADPGQGKTISVTFADDYEESGNFPRVQSVLESSDINSEIFVLGSEVGIFKAYSMKKRFGSLAEDELMQDLTNEVTAELANTLISRLTQAYVGTPIAWSKTPPNDQIAYVEHKLEIKDKIAAAEAGIVAKAGRGIGNVIIAGIGAVGILQTLPGFVKEVFMNVGPGVVGYLDGSPVIRAPQISTLDIYVIYKGTGFFDAPAVYAPYMPLFVTKTMRVPNNLLKREGVAAVWAGMKVTCPNFIEKIVIT